MAQVKPDRVPPSIRKILKIDADLTQKLVLWANRIAPLRSLRIHYKALEITCHGIPWFAFWIVLTWLVNKPSLIPLQVNMLLALTLDIIFVAVAKAYFRRKRPVANTDDALGQIGPDVFSFPSGHASRAILVAYIFIFIQDIHWIFVPPLLAWTVSLAVSRILMNRHYILDVLAGTILGLFEGLLMQLLWLEDDTARYLMSYLSEERLEGPEV